MANTNLSPQHAGFALPLVIAVTGHRDLVPDEIPVIRDRVKILFQEFLLKYPHNRLTVLSPLAEGADMLVAEVAVKMGLDLIVPLPKPRHLYLQDFITESARKKFEELCQYALQVFEVKYTLPPVANGFTQHDWENSYPYANLGVFLCSHCHILLAIWDGNSSRRLGGTAQVVKFHQDDVMPGFTPSTTASQQMLVDDESDLVFHIQCSRDRKGHKQNTELESLDWCWFTKDRETPRSKQLPAQHELIFRRSSEFSADALKFAHLIDVEKWP